MAQKKDGKKRVMVIIREEMDAVLEETAERMTAERGGVHTITKSELIREGINRVLEDYWKGDFRKKLDEWAERLRNEKSKK
jgi:hypothetical protein